MYHLQLRFPFAVRCPCCSWLQYALRIAARSCRVAEKCLPHTQNTYPLVQYHQDATQIPCYNLSRGVDGMHSCYRHSAGTCLPNTWSTSCHASYLLRRARNLCYICEWCVHGTCFRWRRSVGTCPRRIVCKTHHVWYFQEQAHFPWRTKALCEVCRARNPPN